MYEGEYRFCPFCRAELSWKKVDNWKRSSCPVCQWINYKNPLPSAASFVCRGEGTILLVKRGVGPGKGKWALPSGFIEIEETPEKACLRELKEETGLTGKVVRIIGVYSQKSLMYKNVLIIAYEIEAAGNLTAGSDCLDAEFFSCDSLPDIAFSSHKKIIEDGMKLHKKGIRK